MDVDEEKTKPESNRTLLVQQVDEQSEFCDITVKVGSWAKRYHRCVLVGSPFFEHLILGDFLEGQTGVIEMTVGTPEAVDIALMFLYGKKPVMNPENVGILLELAEYFMMQNLKSACINYLHSERLTKENCMDILRLGVTYNFEVKDCIKFIESHLSQLIRGNRLLNLSEDSVKYILSQKRFSYVTMNEKLNFLARWFRKNPVATRGAVEELFQYIDIQEVTQSVLEEVKLESVFSEITGISNITMGCINENECHRVMVTAGRDSFYCLNLQKKIWYRLNSTIYKSSKYPFDEFPYHLTGISSSQSEVYFVGSRYQPKLASINLAADDFVTHSINLGHDFAGWKDEPLVSVNDEIVIADGNKIVQRMEDNLEFFGSFYYSLSGDSVNQVTEIIYNKSALHVGYIAGGNITMSPILSLRHEHISKLCINRQSSVALLLKSEKYIFIFDLVDYKIEKVELEIDEKDRVVENKDGFLIYNDERCVCLDRLRGPSLSGKYRSKEFHFDIIRNCTERYDFCQDIWFRYLFTTEHAELQYTSHEEMISARCSNNRDVKWNRLPLPNDVNLRHCLKKEKMFVLELPMNRLRCHLECPHCEFENKSAKGVEVRNIKCIPSSSEGYYDDSSDFGWQSESEEDYYFSSD